MNEFAIRIIDGLGGTSAVARMISAPISTVHSWRKNGIPPSRLAHLRLAAKAEGKEWPEAVSTPAICSICDRRGDDPAAQCCSTTSCPFAVKEAA